MKKKWLLIALATFVALEACCDGGGGFEPRRGLSGVVTLQNQADNSGVLVRVVSLDSVAVTGPTGEFSFGDIPDGNWRVVAGYPYFETVEKDIEIRDGLQRNSARFNLRQLLRFWVVLPDTFVSFCKCEPSLFGFPIVGYVTNLTDRRITLACGSTPLADYAIIHERERLIQSPTASEGRMARGGLMAQREEETFDVCAADILLLPGELDRPGSVTLYPHQTRVYELTARLQNDCYEDGRYFVYWALVDCSGHPEHYVYDLPDLNLTLFMKPELLGAAAIQLIESTSN